jgi:hypothetical protein
MRTREVSDLASALAIGGSLILAGLALWALFIMGAFGIVGAALAFFGVPIVLFAPTPRSWWFIAAAAGILAAVPAISFALQILRPSPIPVEGRTWSREGGWTPISPPEPFETVLTAAIIGAALFIAIFGALALLKRVGVAAKPSGLTGGL